MGFHLELLGKIVRATGDTNQLRNPENVSDVFKFKDYAYHLELMVVCLCVGPRVYLQCLQKLFQKPQDLFHRSLYVLNARDVCGCMLAWVCIMSHFMPHPNSSKR